jgi:hypothetical protein
MIKILKSEKIKNVISILLGVGIATLFRTSCYGNNCIIKLTDNKIYNYEGKCYVMKKKKLVDS